MQQKRGGHEQKRKVRSDKKVSVAPSISDEYRVWIHRISRQINLPEGDVGARLVLAALQNEKCVAFFRTYFRRPYHMNDHHIMYPLFKPANIYDYLDMGMDRHGRFKLKFSQGMSERLTEFQIALGISFFAHAIKALLEYALNDLGIIQQVAPGVVLADFRKTLPSGNINSNPNAWSIFK